MVNNRTLTIIAKYMARCADNPEWGRMDSFRPLELNAAMRAYLKGKGCYNVKHGSYESKKIFRLLVIENINALKARYSDEQVQQLRGDEGYRFMDEISIDTRKDTRKEWLVNLFEVTRCYLYQIAEGDYKANPLYVELETWIKAMAFVLAEYVVEEIRPRYPKQGEPFKPWEEF